MTLNVIEIQLEPLQIEKIMVRFGIEYAAKHIDRIVVRSFTLNSLEYYFASTTKHYPTVM